ncbi:hypothetical protein FOXB_11871 [Fusarium oxysporum f. sp. conglutinans Fo5176]|uniref:Fungal lipase-type domain-containing protein n=1 Tax=Fusarium oxysporum (strain Fo5176) TaxID=660025 RepID=F9FZN9_FUSOF|nr:hypothetical protein FOXB_11871 [Fusarium oxysporum f. sp. conglutinans Fo5176]
MWASKVLKGRNARSITKTSIAAAASAPTSQAEFSANSQAFSVAVTELLECLDFVLDQLDDQGEHGDLLQFHLSRLAKEISKYENSKVDEQISQPWTENQKDAASVFPLQVSNAKFSLVTFGAPPVTSTNITELAQSLPQTRHIYAVVNEHDLVPRVDQGYITSIISLYRSAYGLPLSDFNNTTFTNNTQADRNQDAIWKLPPPDFYVVGNIIVLRAKLDYNALQSTSSQTNWRDWCKSLKQQYDSTRDKAKRDLLDLLSHLAQLAVLIDISYRLDPMC